MPRYEITAPDGGRYEIMAPEGASNDDVLAYARSNFQAKPVSEKPVSKTESGIRGMFQGLTAGFGEEAVAGVVSAIRPDLFLDKYGKEAGYGDAYRQARDIGREQEAAAQEENPWTYGLSNVAGGLMTAPLMPSVAPMKGVTAMQRLGNAMATGGVYGGVAGLGMGESDLTKGDIAGVSGDIAQGAAIGAGTAGALQGVVETPAQVMNALNKTGRKYADVYLNQNLTGEGVKRSSQKQFAKEGQKLEQELGIRFSAAEKTGNLRATGVEDWLANKGVTADRVAAARKAKVDKLVGRFSQNLDRISKYKTSDLSVGATVEGVYDDVTGNLRNMRRAQAAADFGKAEQLSGGQAFVQPENFVAVLDDFIAQGSSKLTTPAQRAAAGQAKVIRNRLVKSLESGNLEYQNLTIRELQNGLSAFGDASKTSGGIWKDLATAGDRRFAANAKAALERDMDMAIERNAGNKAAQALRVARDRYKEMSGKLEEINQTVIGKYLGSPDQRTPERVAQMLNNMQPTEISGLMKVMNQSSPEQADFVRRYMLESGFRRAMESKGQYGKGLEGQEPIDLPAFLKGMGSDERIAAILGKDKQAALDIKYIVAAANRIQKYGGKMGGSQTAARQDTETLMKAAMDVRNLAQPNMIAGLLMELSRPDMFADIVLNDGLRRSTASVARRIVKQPELVKKLFRGMAKEGAKSNTVRAAAAAGAATTAGAAGYEASKSEKGPLRITIRPERSLPPIQLPVIER